MLEEVGFADAILARQRPDGGLEIVDGHLRRSMDPELAVPVLVLDVNEQEADKLLASLDPLAALAVADPAPLAELLASIETTSEDLRQLFADVASGAEIGAKPGRMGPDEIPDVPAEPASRPGDLYVLGPHRLVCDDATDPGALSRVLGKVRVSLLLSDPPYGVSYEGKTKARLRLTGDQQGRVIDLLTKTLAVSDRVLRPGAAFYLFHPAGGNAPAFLQAIAGRWDLRQILVWAKGSMVLGHADYHFAHELIAYGNEPAQGRRGRGGAGWYGGDAQTSVFQVPRPKSSREHPTAKPVELLSGFIANSSIAGDAVLDPFLGSGSTLIACEQLGRHCFGVEIDPRYVDVAVTRWERFTGRRARRYRRGSDGR